MVYKINYSDHSKPPIMINDGSLDNTTDLTLIGKSYQGGFGDIVAENFIHLLENFSKNTPPERPIEGQIWYDRQNGKLMVYTVNGVWKTTSGVTVSENSPVVGLAQTNGDLWLDTTTKELYIFYEDSWNNIGNADQTTKQYSKNRRDINGIIHKTLELVVNNKTVAIFSGSNTNWIPSSSGNSIERLNDNTIMVLSYPVIRPGINLYNRKNIPDITVSPSSPNISPENARVGDFWYSVNTKEFFIYREQNIWDKISNDIKIENFNPTDLTNYLPGQFWINKNTYNLFLFDGNNWIKISEMTPTTKIVSKNRVDNTGQLHEVLETIIEGKTVCIDSTTNAFWFPASTELLEDGSQMLTYFPRIGSGKNYLIDKSYINYDPVTNSVTGAALGQVPIIRGLAERIIYDGSYIYRNNIIELIPSINLENLNYQEISRVEYTIKNKQDIPLIYIDYTVDFYYNETQNYVIRLKRLEGNGINETDSKPGIVISTNVLTTSTIQQYTRKNLDMPNFIYTTESDEIDVTYVLEAAFIPVQNPVGAEMVIFSTEMSVSRFALGS